MPDKINVAGQLDILVKLQELDAEIFRLQWERQKKPQELAQLKKEFEDKNVRLKAAEEKSKSLLVKRKGKEIELQTKEEQIKKLEIQLYQVKTNKEYSAMQKEIEGVKADMSTVEDEALMLMEDIDNVKVEIEKEKEILKQEEQKLQIEEEKAKLELEKIQKRLDELNKQREQVAPLVGRNLLHRYERLLSGRAGIAIVPVIADACQGCHMNLPPQVINEIKLKQDIVTCESCNRILYIKEEASDK